jgi:hypothetical protein
MMMEELQEQLLAWEEELMCRKEPLAMWEEKTRISKKAQVKVSADLNAEPVKIEATQYEYLNKMEVHTAHA